MSPEERAAYLANVFRIARADGGTGPAEADVLRDVIERIGADADDLAAARRVLDGNDGALSLLGVPSQRLANMEDMVLMALADGHLHPEEAAPIEKVSSTLGFSQPDMDMIVRRAENRLRALQRAAARDEDEGGAPPPMPPMPPPPPSARQPAPRFTPPRRGPTPAMSPAVSAVPPVARSPVSRGAPSEGETEPRSPGRAAGKLNASAAAPAPPLAAPEPRRPPAWARCQAARDASGNPAEYCFGHGSGRLNIWGCRLAGMDWSADADWFAMGSFRDDHTFVFDREAIEKALNERLSAVRECPHVRWDCAREAPRALPPRASQSDRWRYRTVAASADDGNSAVRRVRVREVRHGIAMHTDTLVDALVPVGVRGAGMVLRRALRRAGDDDVDLGLLLKEDQR